MIPGVAEVLKDDGKPFAESALVGHPYLADGETEGAMRRHFQHLLHLTLPLVLPVAIILLWQGAHWLEAVDPSMLPTPGQTFATALSLFTSGSILPDLGMTAIRMSVGFVLAALVGISLGLPVGAFRPVYRMSLPLIDFVRSTPVTILYPVIVLLVGISHTAKIMMVFLGCVFVIALNTAYGVMQASETRKQMAKIYGASWPQVFRWILFYDSLPQTMVGLRVALSYALVVEILCEMFMGSKYGLGQRVTEAFTTYLVDEMYALVLIVGIFGFLLNRAFVLVERRIVPWSTQEHR